MKTFYSINISRQLLIGLCLLFAVSGYSQAATPVVEGKYTIENFAYDDGSRVNLTQHYRTLGTPRRDENGRVENAIIIMHGTTGSGASFLSDRYAGVLFGDGQILDASEYFIILPDAIGHGQSSRPSAGSAANFPKYTYDDTVRALHQLLTDHLKVDHLRLVTGTSMGGMQSWVWGYTYPDFMDAIMPLASLPVEIGGRNRMLRKMMIDAVKNDPDYKEGFYEEQPDGMREAMYSLIFMVSSPLQYQLQAPTREASEAMLDSLVERYSTRIDANDLVWAFDSSRFYNPEPHLEKISAPLMAINSADDQVNPPELGLLESLIVRVPHGNAATLAISKLTRGHGTHSMPSIWGPYLARLLDATETRKQSSLPTKNHLEKPTAAVWQERAPDTFTVRFETTEGMFRIEVKRDDAPLGADRFYQLVSNGFYDGVHINRVVEGFIAQFGIHGVPSINAVWKNNYISDDPVKRSNTRGSVAFAMTGPDTRATQVYINTGNNKRLDADGFAPFGEVIEGMDVIDRLYSPYGENAGGGLRGGRQGPLETGGSDYINQNFPLLDFIRVAHVE
ncbi:alpha/beta fold hydrolase [Brumicola nitratireducens]|uniref:Homoserine acetyltransferase family protein n=1 Tax=Glaciecola nitratireducens (strain JCM 12485 / KCTC 12276 / FR1064) TaxID=1085623 RepID=G4QJV4_GLANF|nr:alpha/beta fold hydrolase [Glaciecola nitratireducens]AEP28996.1 homoserine acetyltransferase family protein [Glaciecola nitratireducens FR1064]